jgi:hypothetical protein
MALQGGLERNSDLTPAQKLRERVKMLEGSEEKGAPPAEPLQRIMDVMDAWTTSTTRFSRCAV